MRSDIAEERQRVVKRESRIEFPLRHPRSGVDGPQKLERANEVRRETQEPTSFAARLEYEMEIPVLEVPQPTMHESRRATRRAAGEVVFLDERNAQSA